MKVLKSDLLEFNSGTFQAWIFEVSRNLCLNRMRTSVRASRGLEKLPSLIDAVESAESLLSNHEDASQVKEALKKLSETHAEILHLKLLGVSEKDIARSLQIPLGTVKSRFHSIVKFLKQEVRGESN